MKRAMTVEVRAIVRILRLQHLIGFSRPQTERHMFRKQLVGIGLAIPAFLAVVLVYRFASEIFARVTLPSDDVAGRLAYALRWLFWPGLTLLVGVIVAGRRGFIADAIDGTRTPASHSLEINLRYNQNTLEQTALAAIAWTGLASRCPMTG